MTRPNPFVQSMPPSDPTFIGVLGKNTRRKMTDIVDGTSNTILLAESAGRNQKWVMGKLVSTTGTTGARANPDTEIIVTGYNPANNTLPGPCAVNCTNQNEIYAFHTGLANAAFADGSVRTLRAGTDVNIILRLTTRGMREVVSPDSY